jgi:pimeloyl-ACP methyl ester carboxylesterase
MCARLSHAGLARSRRAESGSNTVHGDVTPTGVPHDVAGPAGRTLRVVEAGRPDGVPVLVHHGTPGGWNLPASAVADAETRGLRLIGYDRPGYGASETQPGRAVADCAADVAAIADALEIPRFVSWGMSGGGPHVLACAALLRTRVAAVASLSGVAPFEAEGLDWMAGMGEGNVAEFGAAVEGADCLQPLLEHEAQAMLGASPEEVATAMRSVLSPPDLAAFDGDIGDWIYDSVHNGLEGGIDGWRDDDLAFVKPWGFALDAIAVPVLIVQGHQDLMVPPTHGEWLAAHVPGAESRIRPDEGHLTSLRAIGEVHAWLLERLLSPTR